MLVRPQLCRETQAVAELRGVQQLPSLAPGFLAWGVLAAAREIHFFLFFSINKICYLLSWSLWVGF